MTTPQLKRSDSSDDTSKRVQLSSDKDLELSSTLSDIRTKEKESLVEREAKARGHHYTDLHKASITHDALLIIDRAFCEQERVVCFYYQNDEMRLGTTDPENPKVQTKAQELEEAYRARVAVYRVSEEGLAVAFKKYDSIPKEVHRASGGVELTAEKLKEQQEKIKTIAQLNEMISKAPITEVLALIVGSALKTGASDIHIEAEAEAIKVRLRIDGFLHDVAVIAKDLWDKIISRVKLIAGVKINVTDKPQDGRFTITVDDEHIEVRTSTVPTAYGESVVMRLLRFSLTNLQFENLGLMGYTLSALEHEIKKPNGMIIATGPTGCGKTTTLYAIVHILNDPGTKILTLEDPVEYKIKGINQTQVDAAGGYTFANGLRSLLRQDPDILMVGEIRDLETAETSINAALTGHLLLSTLHTNSAAGAIPRFLAMGSKTFLLAPSLNALIGQRLVRRLCQHCKKQETIDEAMRARVHEALRPLAGRTDLGAALDLEHPLFYTAAGCDECSNIGYKGRIGVFEILTMNKDIERIILAGNVSENDVLDAAIAHGMVTMLQDGLMKAMQGITSLSEVFRQAEK